MNAGIETTADRLLSALFNGAYQGLLVTAVIMLLLRLAPRTNAATRHAVAGLTLVVVALLPVFHFFGRASGRAARLASAKLALASRPLDDGKAFKLPAKLNLASGMSSNLLLMNNSPATEPPPSPASVPPSRSDPPGLSADNSISSLAEEAAVETESSPSVPTQLEGAPTIAVGPALGESKGDKMPGSFLSRLLSAVPWGWRFSLPHTATVLLLLSWALLAGLRLAGVVRQYVRLHTFKRRGGVAPEGLRALFEWVVRESGIRRKTEPRVSPEVVSPLVLGFRQPVVLLPSKLLAEIPEAQLQQVLRHELAHVRRYDDWANFCQQIVRATLFYDPAVRWLSRRLTTEREIACDDQVLAATRNPRAYALFLTEFASRTQGRKWLAAPAAWSNKNQLKERIGMILDSKRNSSPRLARARAGVLTSMAALLAAVALYAGPRLALAAAPEPPAPLPVPPVQPVLPPAALAAPVVAPIDLAMGDSAPLDVPVSVSAPVEVSVDVGAPAPPAPTPPPVPRAERGRKAGGDDSLEARVERLERLVKTLLAREQKKQMGDALSRSIMGLKGPDAEALLKQSSELHGKLLSEDLVRSKEQARNFAEDLARIKEQAKNAAESAAQQAKRAADEVRRAAREAERMARRDEQQARREEGRARIEEQPGRNAPESRSFDSQRRQLEQQRQALERQLKAVAEQLDHLKRDQQRMKADRDRQDADRLKSEREQPEHISPPDAAPQDDSSDSVKKRKI